MILTLITIIFWVMVYILEGLHDINVIRSSDSEKTKEIRLWHFWDSLMFLVIHLFFIIFIYIISNNLLFSLKMFILSLGLRISIHETMINLILHKNLFYRPNKNQNNWFDSKLSKCNNLIVFMYRYGIIITGLLLCI